MHHLLELVAYHAHEFRRQSDYPRKHLAVHQARCREYRAGGAYHVPYVEHDAHHQKPLEHTEHASKQVVEPSSQKRVRDFAQVKYDGIITLEAANTALDLLDVDKLGLDQTDRQILIGQNDSGA